MLWECQNEQEHPHCTLLTRGCSGQFSHIHLSKWVTTRRTCLFTCWKTRLMLFFLSLSLSFSLPKSLQPPTRLWDLFLEKSWLDFNITSWTRRIWTTYFQHLSCVCKGRGGGQVQYSHSMNCTYKAMIERRKTAQNSWAESQPKFISWHDNHCCEELDQDIPHLFWKVWKVIECRGAHVRSSTKAKKKNCPFGWVYVAWVKAKQ